MNLHNAVSGAIGTVNPLIMAALKKSDGYMTQADGTQAPVYIVSTGYIQAQATDTRDIERLNNLSIQGVFKTVYLSGEWSAISRSEIKGGDMFIFSGKDWKVIQVKENWPDWTSVIVAMQ